SAELPPHCLRLVVVRGFRGRAGGSLRCFSAWRSFAALRTADSVCGLHGLATTVAAGRHSAKATGLLAGKAARRTAAARTSHRSAAPCRPHLQRILPLLDAFPAIDGGAEDTEPAR